VRAGFADMAAADPHRWVVVDGNRPIDDVEADIVAAVVERLGLAPT
jgi:thymidylate kinase